MIADLKPYAEYKDSGLPWLGQVPVHWEVRRLKQTTRFVYGDALPQTGRSMGEVPVYGSNGRVGWHSNSNALAPCIIVGRKGSFGKVNYCQDASFVIDTAFFIDARVTKANLRWLYYALSWIGLDRISKDSAVPGLDRDDAYQQLAVVPPPAEQAAIVRFLDWTSGRLERAIRAKRKVVALLNEQKQAIIHRAVTRGLDPNVRLKSSGIPWLEEIPEHWGIVRNLALFSHRVESGQAGLPVFQVSLRTGITTEEIDQFGRPKRLISDYIKYKRIHKDDVAYNTMRMWQGAVGVAPGEGLVSPAYVVLCPRGGTFPNFYNFVFQTDVYKQQVNRQSTGIVSDRNRLYWDSFKQMQNVSVPYTEQKAIVAWINTETVELNRTKMRLECEIDLLREYRTRLVADVVTGKLDVRAAAAALPDEAPLDVAPEEDLDSPDADESLDEEEDL